MESIPPIKIDDDTLREKSSMQKISQRKQAEMKPMTEEEALLQMEVMNHHSFMFFDATTHHVNLLYRNKNGDYTLLEGLPL
jgi:putative sigma-54 modulation protein